MRVGGDPALSLYVHQMNRVNSRSGNLATAWHDDSTINIILVIIKTIFNNIIASN